jgi:hypothetical protein
MHQPLDRQIAADGEEPVVVRLFGIRKRDRPSR